MFEMNQLLKVKKTGQVVRVCGFANPENLPKPGEQYHEHVKHFEHGSGIPPEFAEHAADAPSADAVFCFWHEPDEKHPKRVAQQKKADAAVAQADKDGSWINHVPPVAPAGTPDDAEFSHFGKLADIKKMDDATIKRCALARVEASHIREGYVHGWFTPDELTV